MADRAYPITLILLIVLMEVFAVITFGLSIAFMNLAFMTTDGTPSFNYDTIPGRFPFHPVCSIAGFIVLMGNAVIMFRLTSCCNHLVSKIFHAILNTLVMPLIVFALVAMFTRDTQLSVTSAYSLHSWVGLALVVLFGIQWLIGAVIFIIPKIPTRVRSGLVPVHRYMGNFLVLLTVGNVIVGINTFLFNRGSYRNLTNVDLLGNFTGLFAFFFGMVAFFILQYPRYRKVREEEITKVVTVY